LESNWRWNVWRSGLTQWNYGPLGPYPGQFIRIARLIVPFYIGPFLIEAIHQLELNGDRFIEGTTLRGGTYPEGTFSLGVPVNTPFPGGFDVVPDHPAVEWD